ncbi:Uncharacterised protein [Enterococcus faecalis]|nr:hypothetical protein [Enterococcus faecalis]VTS80129.1 Uncharacterised protein [Enterococcus faecalis]
MVVGQPNPNYLVSLIGAYNSLGQKFKWIDKEAIEKIRRSTL